MIPRRPVLVTGPQDAMDRNMAGLVNQPLPYDSSLVVVNIVSFEIVPTPFGGADPDETRTLVLVDCLEKGGGR